MKKWEYKVVKRLNEKKANELGSEGWELISFEVKGLYGFLGGMTKSRGIFKREVK